MVQEFVEGISFEKFTKESPEVAKAAVVALADEWLDIALTGNGFFHADLHQGNLRVNKVGDTLTVNLLDFGMTGQIDASTQNRFIVFGIASGYKNADLMAKVIWDLSVKSKNEVTLDQLKTIFQAELDREKSEGIQEWPLAEWVSLSVNSGMRFPSEFTTLNRGTALLARMLEDYGMPSDFGGRIKNILLKNPQRLASLLADREVMKLGDWYRLITGSSTQSSETADKAKPAPPPASVAPKAARAKSSKRLCADIFAATGS